MELRIYNARILTPDGIIDGEMRTEDGLISYVNTVSTMDLRPWDREIDARRNLILPTFKNAHAHSPMTFLRSYAEDLPLGEWLTEKVFPKEDLLTPEDCYWLTKLAICEYVSGGVSACADMYFNLEAMAAAGAECGFREILIEGITKSNGGRDKVFKQLDDGRKLNGLGGVVEYRLGLHAEYTNDDESVRNLAEYAKAYKMPVYTHASETASETRECTARHGTTPPIYFARNGLFDYGGAAYHLVHATGDDIRVLKEYGVSAVTCPASNAKLGSGIAPLKEFIEAGLKVGIGTDGPASNNALDMFRETYLAAVMQKLVHGADAMDAGELLGMAVSGDTLGLYDADAIAPGKKADFMLIDMHAPNMQPTNDIIKNLVYAGGKQNVLMSVVNGKILYEKGEWFVGEDIEKIYSECDSIAERIVRGE